MTIQRVTSKNPTAHCDLFPDGVEQDDPLLGLLQQWEAASETVKFSFVKRLMADSSETAAFLLGGVASDAAAGPGGCQCAAGAERLQVDPSTENGCGKAELSLLGLALRWLRPPAATQLRLVEDPLGEFLDRNVVRVKGARVQSTELHRLYSEFVKETASPRWSLTRFSVELKKRGFRKIKSNSVWWVDLQPLQFSGGRYDR